MRIWKLILLGFFIYCGWFFIDAGKVVLQTPEVPYGSLILKDHLSSIITNKGKHDGSMIPYEGSLSGKLFDAIIAVEDHRFFTHHGGDLFGKLSGILENIEAGAIVRGSSTITEQYIKNAYYRGQQRTVVQKIKEAIGAVVLENVKTKDEILRFYLDHIYFGNRIYGIEMAMRTYYPGKIPETLTNDDILDIITRIKKPNISTGTLDDAQKYRSSIAKKLGWEAGVHHLINDTSPRFLDAYPLITSRVEGAIENFCHGNTEPIQQWMFEGTVIDCSSPFQEIILSIDQGLMRIGKDAITQSLSGLRGENVTNAAVYIYHPVEKKVLAYIGNAGEDASNNAVDMIIKKRSVGSLLKPWIYLLALKNGAEIEQFILDDIRVYPTGTDGKAFIPNNYSPRFYGPIRLREALGNSLNAATVRLTESLGIFRIVDFLKESGLQLEHDAGYYGYGISIGNVELSLENIVQSASSLIDMNDPNLFLLRNILSDPRNRAKTFGISSILNSTLNLPVKTGTSTDFRDNWTLSYHPDAIIGVWVGNADGSSMQDVSGVSGASPIWHAIEEYMTTYGYLHTWKSSPPPGITETSLCLDQTCKRSIQTYMKHPGTIRSRSDDNQYYKDDFISEITEEEKKKWNIE